MSNTLNTPVEALETEFPLRVRELSVRRGSGGGGRHRGGDGIVRELEALAPMRFTLITERRRHAPRGRDGGADGAPGRNPLNGEPLPSKAEGDLRPATCCESRPRAAAGTVDRVYERLIWRFGERWSRMPRFGRAVRPDRVSRRPASQSQIHQPSPGTAFKCRSLSRNGP